MSFKNDISTSAEWRSEDGNGCQGFERRLSPPYLRKCLDIHLDRLRKSTMASVRIDDRPVGIRND
jgi:hypothetical protein